jgi:hypothetical protein
MWGLCLSSKMLSMHPTLMTIIADDRAHELRAAAELRRGRAIRRGSRRFFLLSRRPRRSARMAHA